MSDVTNPSGESTEPQITMIEIDLSSTPLVEPPIRPGVRKLLCAQASIVPKAKEKPGYNLMLVLQVTEDGKTKSVRNWTGTDNSIALARIWESAGLDRKDTVAGFDITKLVAREMVGFVKNDFQDDPVNPGQKVERSGISQFLVPSDTSYGTAT